MLLITVHSVNLKSTGMEIVILFLSCTPPLEFHKYRKRFSFVVHSVLFWFHSRENQIRVTDKMCHCSNMKHVANDLYPF